MQYKNPKIVITKFQESDVITASEGVQTNSYDAYMTYAQFMSGGSGSASAANNILADSPSIIGVSMAE